MPACLECGGDCPPGFVLCTKECSQRWGRAEVPNGQRELELVPPGYYTAEDLHKRHGINKTNFYNWRSAGKVTSKKINGVLFFSEEEVLKVYEKSHPVQGDSPEPKKAEEIGSLLQLEPFRERGLKAAKEAFRDIILEGADEAKARGDFRSQAKFLEEYLFFEEGLKLSYEGRAHEHS